MGIKERRDKGVVGVEDVDEEDDDDEDDDDEDEDDEGEEDVGETLGRKGMMI